MVTGGGRLPCCAGAHQSFDARIAATHEAKWPELFDPAVIEPVVRFLASPGRGRASPSSSASAPAAPPSRAPRRARARDRPVTAHGGAPPGQPGGGDVGVTGGDFATTRVGGLPGLRLPGPQHDHEPDPLGRPGRPLRRRRRPAEPGGCRGSRWSSRSCSGSRPARPCGRSPSPTSTSASRRPTSPPRSRSRTTTAVDGQLETLSAPFRYVWPLSRPDGSARRHGPARALEHWTGAPFTSDSTVHVSVWEKPATQPPGAYSQGAAGRRTRARPR